MKRVFIVHCWDGAPDKFWYPWLAAELKKQQYSVSVLKMPNTAEPRITPWVKTLADAVGAVDAETYFIGHSIGSQTVLRYLTSQDKQSGGCVFVAPWLTLSSGAIATTEEAEIAKPWLRAAIDDARVRASTGPIMALFSEDDPLVPIENLQQFRDRFGAKTMLLTGRGHFDKPEMKKLAEALVAFRLLTPR